LPYLKERRKEMMKRMILFTALVMMTVLLAAAPALAASIVVDLTAETGTVTMPDATVVPIWGFKITGSPDPVSLPGPQITLAEGDDLTINLTNNLNVPVSIVIPGQITTMTPVWVDIADPYGTPTGTGSRPALDTTSRVRSFTHETAPLSTGVYTWTGVKAGTFIYQSGTHPALQVQMGLYGAVVANVAAGEAYTGVTYDSEAMLFYSELDPVFHGAVSDVGPVYPPTNVYNPRYFLINGQPYSGASLPIAAGSVGQSVLIRFLNAGLDTHMPMIKGMDMSIIAEDGYPKPFARDSYVIQLHAGKTVDAILNPTNYGTYPVLDRRLFLVNSMQTPGGMLAMLAVGSSGATDVGVVRGNRWYQDNDGNRVYNAGSDVTFTFGVVTDIPVTGDWNGDGVTEAGVVRGNRWYLDMNGNGIWEGAGPDITFVFGTPTDIPVTGDWNGDGTTDVGAYRASNNGWYLDLNGNHAFDAGIDRSYVFAVTGTPVTGDWNGDGFTDIGKYDAGTWYLDADGNKAWNVAVDTTYTFNPAPGALAVTGDWDGNGSSEIGVFLNGTWYLDSNGNGIWEPGVDETFVFGNPGDKPVTGIW